MATTSNRRLRRGQGIIGYVVLVALLAIAGIGVLALFGGNLGRLFGSSNDAVGSRGSAKNAPNNMMRKSVPPTPTSAY